MSCKEPIKMFIVDEVSYYLTLMFSVVAITFACLLLMIIVLIYRCCLLCKTKRANEEAKPRQRAINGMVVGSDDFDDVRGASV